MDDQSVYDGYVEVLASGACLAQILDLPGCFAHGASVAEAIQRVTAEIPDYFAWLRRHDDYTPEVRGPFRVTPLETISSNSADRPVAFFTPDAEPITAEDLDWYLALLDWAYEDLDELTHRFPDAALERPAADGSTPRRLIERAAQSQLWLVSRIELEPHTIRLEQLPGTLGERLRQVRRASIARFRATNEDERQRITEYDGERWSLRKVLRLSVLQARTYMRATERSISA